MMGLFYLFTHNTMADINIDLEDIDINMINSPGYMSGMLNAAVRSHRKQQQEERERSESILAELKKINESLGRTMDMLMYAPNMPGAMAAKKDFKKNDSPKKKTAPAKKKHPGYIRDLEKKAEETKKRKRHAIDYYA